MILSVGCTLGYQIISPTANFTFNVLVNTDPEQRLRSEGIAFVPDMTSELNATSKGNRVLRAEAVAGPFELRYTAAVETSRPPQPTEARPENLGRMPLTLLTYLLPSRYCESDRFTQIAIELFGKTDNRAEQVQQICRWVDQNIAYVPGASDSRTSAWDVWTLRKGVCRDLTHLSIAFCRALNIPARYVGAYAVGLSPMDFHACLEAYVGGAWHLYDPSDQTPAEDIAIIARGRDAANAALATIFGKVTGTQVKVECRRGE